MLRYQWFNLNNMIGTVIFSHTHMQVVFLYVSILETYGKCKVTENISTSWLYVSFRNYPYRNKW